ncbi:MAG TPA: lipid A biosynthesis acyltransferase [Deltaproteobacteria bacterium]|mgnify:CR=1 FL=1|nr:lipid A biosynthesis acyltransferase [Deltaproteobacteria bacterium]
MKGSIKIKLAVFIFSGIPLAVRRGALSFLSYLAYYLSLKHRLITIHNLTRSFPGNTLENILKIAKASYRSFAIMAAEFPELYRLSKDNLHRRIEVKGLQNYIEACREGKGVLLFSAHFGNWEIGNAALALLTTPLIFMVRRLDSPFLEELTTYLRAICGNLSLHKQKAMRQSLRLMENGETINILIDQNVSVNEGVFVDFFGRPACATSGLTRMAQRTGAAVMPAFTIRLPNGKYLLEIGPKIEIINTGNLDEDVLLNTQKFNTVIEEYVRKYPEQWLWLHQRWKTKPWQVKSRNKK